MGREPPVDKAGATQFLVPISNYNGLLFRSQAKSEISVKKVTITSSRQR
jgi:hypothetical protein